MVLLQIYEAKLSKYMINKFGAFASGLKYKLLLQWKQKL